MFKNRAVFQQFLCVVPVCCMYYLVGLGRGWIAPILKEANDPHSELPLTSEESSWMASINYVTRGLSPLFLSFLVDKVGRKSILVFNAAIFFGMWIAVYWSRNVFVHYCIRLIFGLSDGLQDAVSGIYVCENCSPELRGVFYTLVILFLFTGHFFAFVFANYCSYNCIAIVYAVFGFTALITTLLLVEPPQYLLLKGNIEQAKKNFAQLRGTSNPDTEKEFEATKKNVEEEKFKTFSLATFGSKEVLRSMRYVLITMTLCAACGWGPLLSFVTKLFSNSDGLSANELSMLYGLFQLLSVGVSSFFIEKLGRRTIMIASGVMVSVTHLSIVALYSFQKKYEIPGFHMILCGLLTLYSTICAGFITPIMGLIRGELFPQNVKMIGGGLSQFLISLVSLITAKLFLPINDTYGISVNFSIYACSALALAVYIYFDLPETRGKTLVEIQNELKGLKSTKTEGNR